MAYPGRGEIEALVLAGSIREFGGALAQAPVWVLVPGGVERLTEASRTRLEALGARLIPFEVDAEAQKFPFAPKVIGAGKAEEEAVGKAEVLAWLDSDTIVIHEPGEMLLPADKSLGVRPVAHLLIGSRYEEPPDDFWKLIYESCAVPMNRVYPMRSVVDRIEIRPYYNAGMLILRPEKGILRAWRDEFNRLYRDERFASFYQRGDLYSIFVHQAILAGVILTRLGEDEIRELSPAYNYYLNLHDQTSPDRQARALNDLVTCRYDLYPYLVELAPWREAVAIEEPLKSWLDNQLRFKGVIVLALLDTKFGANSFLYRDAFEQMGWNTVLTGISPSIEPCDFFGKPLGLPPFKPWILFNQLRYLDGYRALVIMPASGYFQERPFQQLIDDETALGLVKKAVEHGLAVMTTCHGVRVLAAADVIRGKKVVAQPKNKSEIEQAGGAFLGADHAPSIEGNVITGARGQYYHLINAQAVAIVIENNQGRGDHQRAPDSRYFFRADAGFADPGIEWAAAYGGAGSDGARSIIRTEDGGFLAVGYTFSRASGDADLLVFKIDASGNLLWNKAFGGAGSEYGLGCAATGDGYLAVGYTTSYGAGSRDVYLLKLDREGNEVFAKTYGGASWDVGAAVCDAGDGGYFVTGHTHSSGAGEEDVYLIKTDGAGNEVWSRTYGGERSDVGAVVIPHEKGGCVIGATTGTFGGGNCDFYLLRIGASGEELWSRNIGSKMDSPLSNPKQSPFDWCSSIVRAADGGFFLAGYSNSRDLMNACVVKTDASGNLLWEKNFGRSAFYDYGNAIAATADGGAILCGASKNLEGNNDLYLVALAPDGSIAWEKTIGGAGSDWGSALCLSEDGAVVIAGHTSSAGNGGFDACAIKIDRSGQ